MGQAASAAAVLLAAGAPGKRSVLRHAKVLLHQPSSQAQGTLPDLAIQAKEVARVRAEMDEILSRHTGHPVDQDQERHRPEHDLQRAPRRSPTAWRTRSSPAASAGSRPSWPSVRADHAASRHWASPAARRRRPGRPRTALQPDDLRPRAPVAGQVASDLGQQVGQLDAQGVADGGQDLGGGLLAAALHLGQVRHRDLRGPGHVGQGPALLPPGPAQHVAERRSAAAAGAAGRGRPGRSRSDPTSPSLPAAVTTRRPGPPPATVPTTGPGRQCFSLAAQAPRQSESMSASSRSIRSQRVRPRSRRNGTSWLATVGQPQQFTVMADHDHRALPRAGRVVQAVARVQVEVVRRLVQRPRQAVARFRRAAEVSGTRRTAAGPGWRAPWR